MRDFRHPNHIACGIEIGERGRLGVELIAEHND